MVLWGILHFLMFFIFLWIHNFKNICIFPSSKQFLHKLQIFPILTIESQMDKQNDFTKVGNYISIITSFLHFYTLAISNYSVYELYMFFGKYNIMT